MDTHLLEVNLISAQGLKFPISKFRRLSTYAVAWVIPSAKLRTRIDRVGAENPTWNDKFIFRVAADFLRSETSGVAVEIYAVGLLKDTLVGSVRFFISSFIPTGFPLEDALSEDLQIPGIGSPAFNAFQIRRPSGRFQGVLNVGAMVIVKSMEFAGFGGVSAIGYRDLMGKRFKRHRRAPSSSSSQLSDDLSSSVGGGDSCGKSFNGDSSVDLSDGSESASSSSSRCSTPSMVLKDLNGRDLVAGNGCGMMLCRKVVQKKKIDNPISTADENIRALPPFDPMRRR
ncbi:hypothetical protein Dimus_025312 [Dionaea muscipula]